MDECSEAPRNSLAMPLLRGGLYLNPAPCVILSPSEMVTIL